MRRINIQRAITAVAAVATSLVCSVAFGQEKVKMGLFIASSAMPYFIAKERGYFAAENLDVEGIPFATHPLIVQGLVKGDLSSAFTPTGTGRTCWASSTDWRRNSRGG